MRIKEYIEIKKRKLALLEQVETVIYASNLLETGTAHRELTELEWDIKLEQLGHLMEIPLLEEDLPFDEEIPEGEDEDPA